MVSAIRRLACLRIELRGRGNTTRAARDIFVTFYLVIFPAVCARFTYRHVLSPVIPFTRDEQVTKKNF
jgi:hypothetical protein